MERQIPTFPKYFIPVTNIPFTLTKTFYASHLEQNYTYRFLMIQDLLLCYLLSLKIQSIYLIKGVKDDMVQLFSTSRFSLRTEILKIYLKYKNSAESK